MRVLTSRSNLPIPNSRSSAFGAGLSFFTYLRSHALVRYVLAIFLIILSLIAENPSAPNVPIDGGTHP